MNATLSRVSCVTDTTPSILPGTFPFPRPAPTTESLSVWTVSQFLSYEPPVGGSFLGDGLIEAGEFTSIVGIGGLGKSRIVLWFCLCQILGRPWCGLPTGGEPQNCLFLSTENGKKRWKADLFAMTRGLSTEEIALLEKHLAIMVPKKGEPVSLDLSDHDAVARIAATLRERKPGIVIFDPLADILIGDENKTADVVASLRLLRHTVTTNAPDAATLLIHHARTGAANVAQAGDNFSSGNFGRGAKALYSSVRCELQLAPGDRDDPSKLVLACGKANNSERFSARGIVFDPDSFSYLTDPGFDLDSWRDDVAGKRSTSKAVTIADVVEVVRELAGSVGAECSAGDIQRCTKDRFGVAEKTIRARLSESCRLGYLRTMRKGFYRLGAKPLPK